MTQVHPELEDQRPVIGKGILEGHDAVQVIVESGLVILVIHAPQYRLRIPGTQEQADVTFWRQITPESPVFRPVALFIRRIVVGPGDQPARIHPLIEDINGVALAGSINTGKQDDDRKTAVYPEICLRLEQGLPK